MRIFRVVTFSLNKHDTLTAILTSSLGVAKELNGNHFRTRFSVSDPSFGRVSAVDRAIKNYPELSKFRYIDPTSPGSPAITHDYAVLSNLTNDWEKPNPNNVCDDIDSETLLGIAAGIPRTYPFEYATFVLDGIDWFKEGKTEISPAVSMRKASEYSPYLSASIQCYSHAGFPKRRLAHLAIIELKTPSVTTRSLPELDLEVQQLLGTLGKTKNVKTVSVATHDELAGLDAMNQKANEVVKNYTESLDSILSRIALSHRLEETVKGGTRDSVSPKTALAAVFRRMGYKYLSNESGQGIYLLSKRTKNNNEVQLSFDLGPIGRRLSWSIQVQGPLWKHGLDLKFYPNIHPQYPVTGQHSVEMLIDNARDIAASLEGSFVSEIEDIYGAAPGWYVYRD